MYVVGIVAASILGYILPVCIYLKTHEERVWRRLAAFGVCECFTEGGQEKHMDEDDEEEEERAFSRNVGFFVLMGVFGATSLLAGLAVELRHMLGGGGVSTDPTAEY